MLDWLDSIIQNRNAIIIAIRIASSISLSNKLSGFISIPDMRVDDIRMFSSISHIWY